MKRLLFLLTFFVLTTSVKAQFVKPAGAVALPTYSFFYNTSDSTVTMYKGMTYTYNQLLSKWDSIKVKGYATNFKLLSYRQIRDTLTKDGTASNYRLLHKIDSIMSLVKYRNDSILPSGYASKYYVGGNFTAKNDSSKLYERISNKVTSISSGSTNVQYPSALLLYNQLLLKKASSDSVGNPGFYTNYKASLGTGFYLPNDTWTKVYDYAGNLTNGWKKSKDNIFEFAGILGINQFYHVLNPGINEIVNIPLSTASLTGTEHGVEVTVGGNKIMKVSAKVSATGTADSTRVTLSPGTKLGIGKNGTASVDIEAGTTTRAALKFTAGDTLTIRQPRTIGYKGISFYINDNLILSGKTTIGSTAAPTAKLMLGAGNTNANTAPQKFISGPLNTTPEVGAVEFLTDKWYGTITTGAARKTFAFLERPNFIDSIRTPVGRFTTGAGLGKIAKSDANGVLVWSDPTTYYLGTWNAATNTPTIADGTGTAGQWYRTVVKGVWGADSARVGSDVYYSGSVWKVIPNATFFLQTMTKTVLGGGKMDSLTIKYNGSGQLMVDTADTQILGRGRAANTYEPKFVHNTGFNLNLGTTGGTVLEGRTFGTAANSATTDFVAYRTFGTAANNNTGDFQPMASILTNIQDSLNVRKAKNDSINVRWGYTTLYQNSLKANSSHNQAQSTITGLADSLLARYTKTQANTIYSTKVDKESGKHLPDNNFTDADSTAMANLAANLGAKSDTSTTGQHVRNITTAHGINNLVVKNDSSKYYKFRNDSILNAGYASIYKLGLKKASNDSVVNSGFYTNYKASFLQSGLINDQWLTARDYAGNTVNLLKISKDNLLEFAPKVGINAFNFVLNPGFNYFADIPISSEGAGVWHGTGIRVGGIDILKANIYGLADSARIEVPSIKMTDGAGYRKIPISRNSLGWLKYSAAAYADSIFANRLMAGTSQNVLGQLPLGTDRKILMGITDSVPKWKVPTTYDITPQGNRYFITPTDTIQLDNLATNLSAKVDKEAGKHLPDNNFTDADSIKLLGITSGATVYTDAMADARVVAGITGKEPTITAGTIDKYWRGDKTWQTLPTYTLSGLGGVALADSVGGGAGKYATGKALANHAALAATTTTSGHLSSTDWNTFNNKQPAGSYLVAADIAGKLDTTKATYVLRGQWNTAYGWGNHASVGYVTGTPWTSVGYWYSGNHPTKYVQYGLDSLKIGTGAADAAAGNHNHSGTYEVPLTFGSGIIRTVNAIASDTTFNLKKTTAASMYQAKGSYLTSLSGAVLTDQTSGQTIGATGTRLTKLWATDITVTNAISSPNTPILTVQALSGTSVSWDCLSGINATLTLSGTTTVTLSNVTAGTSGNIKVTNPLGSANVLNFALSGKTVLISPSVYISSGRVLTSGSSKIDMYSWYYDGTNLIINGSNDYK